jgi:hypothetical protein
MNERIQELWSQAEEEIKAEYEDESRRNRRLYNEIFLPKFAQLIVQECIDIIAPYTVRMSRPGEEYLHPILEIKQHFGVEE